MCVRMCVCVFVRLTEDFDEYFQVQLGVCAKQGNSVLSWEHHAQGCACVSMCVGLAHPIVPQG